MPKHEPLPVTKPWCRDVRAELSRRGRGAQAELFRFLKDRGHDIKSTGHLSEILSGKYATSDIVGSVHEFLGWTKPLMPTTSRDAGELAYGYLRLTPEQRAKLSLGADEISELSGEEAREMLKMLLGNKNTK